MSDNKETTTVQTADINLDELLGTPGAENIMLPDSGEEAVRSGDYCPAGLGEEIS